MAIPPELRQHLRWINDDAWCTYCQQHADSFASLIHTEECPVGQAEDRATAQAMIDWERARDARQVRVQKYYKELKAQQEQEGN